MSLAAIAAMSAWSPVPALGADGPKEGEAGLVVHEWGVAVRRETTRGPLLSSPAELVSGLPPFVVRRKTGRTLQPQGWDKPVIWFYGPDGMKVSVKVTADRGFATACFPAAEVLTRRFSHIDGTAMMASLLTESAGFRWRGTLTREPTGGVPEVPKDHWWRTARSAGGLYFNVKGVSERFLFYEASAFQAPTVSAEVTVDAIAIRNAHDAPSGQVIVLVNTADKHYMRVWETVGPGAAVKLARGEVMKEFSSADRVLVACAEQWKSFGMTAPEADAIDAVWREDLLKPQRFLLISRMPPKLYDAMFPLTVTPPPVELVRVGMVFDALDDQGERAVWFPGLNEKLIKAAVDLASDDFKQREAASRELARWGSLARGVLEKLARSEDAEVRGRAQALLERLVPDVDAPAREGTDEKGAVIRAVK